MDLIIFRPIGVIHSPFKDQAGTPIQPRYAEDAVGTVVVDEAFQAALRDLEGFERIWLIYYFHRSGPWRPLVVPFRADVERGLFATRAPARPNSIGMSAVKLVAVKGNVLEVQGLDILDGTPLLDIKPYVPAFDVYPGSRAGWLDESGTDRKVDDGRFSPLPDESH
jgi:tRNA-Thr(GGU) m(6)t(6)A37 methyltransferase TsaA